MCGEESVIHRERGERETVSGIDGCTKRAAGRSAQRRCSRSYTGSGERASFRRDRGGFSVMRGERGERRAVAIEANVKRAGLRSEGSQAREKMLSCTRRTSTKREEAHSDAQTKNVSCIERERRCDRGRRAETNVMNERRCTQEAREEPRAHRTGRACAQHRRRRALRERRERRRDTEKRSDDAQTGMHRANEESVRNVTQDVKERT